MQSEQHNGWGWARQLLVVAALLNWLPRASHVAELYSNAGITLTSGIKPLSQWVVFSPTTAWIIYALLIVGLICIWMGKFGRWSVLLVLLTSLALILQESINFKAYDRLLLWHEFILFLAPVRKRGSPGPRMMAILYMMGIYAMTGWSKILSEPLWWEGTPLLYLLVHREFGLTYLGVWISRFPQILKAMGWMTLIFEAGFPLLFFIRRIRPLLLLVGVSFHVGTWLLMDVGSFWFVSLVVYPVMLTKEQLQSFETWLEGRRWGPAILMWVHRYRNDAVE